MYDFELGRVYVLETSDGKIKIGKTTNFSKRVEQIRSTSGKPISQYYLSKRTPQYSKLEEEMHYIFRNNKIKSEWYDYHFETVCYQLLKLEKSIEFDSLKRCAGIFLKAFHNDCMDLIAEGLCDSLYCPNYNKQCITDNDFELLFDRVKGKFNHSENQLEKVNKIKRDIVQAAGHVSSFLNPLLSG